MHGSVCVSQGYISLCLPGFWARTARGFPDPSAGPWPLPLAPSHTPPHPCVGFQADPTSWPVLGGKGAALRCAEPAVGWCGGREEVQDESPSLSVNTGDSDRWP